MKVCKNGHRFEGPRCLICQSAKNASYYQRDRIKRLANAKAERELVKKLKAMYPETRIAAGQ